MGWETHYCLRRTPHGVRELKYVTRLDVACDGRAPHGVRELKSAHPRGRLPMFNVVLLTGYVSCKNATIPSGTGIQVAPLMGCVS